MNNRCTNCNGKGVVQKDGKHLGNRQPYTLICPSCNGVGHWSLHIPGYDDRL